MDISCNDWSFPRPQFYDALKRLVDAGFEKRLLFGSDQMMWPQAIGIAIDAIERAEFLTANQKRDILYDNAARFLRLSKEQIARDTRATRRTTRSSASCAARGSKKRFRKISQPRKRVTTVVFHFSADLFRRDPAGRDIRLIMEMPVADAAGRARRRSRLGGLLNYYERAA